MVKNAPVLKDVLHRFMGFIGSTPIVGQNIDFDYDFIKTACKKYNISFVDADYDPRKWFEMTKGMEHEPERGKRCTTCFDMRFIKTAEYAHNNGFDIISSTLGISRWKNMEQINKSGIYAVSKFKDITYWTYN